MVDLNEKIKLPSKPHFEYFNSNPPRLWDFESFKKYKTAQAVHLPRNKKIRANYEEAIQNIVNLSYISSEMKDYLDALLNPEVILNEYYKLTWSINLLSFMQSDKKNKENNAVVNQYINYKNVVLRGSTNDNINVHIHTIKRRRHNDEEEDHSGGDNGPDDDDYIGVDSPQPGSPSRAAEVEVEEHDSFLTDETDHTYQTEVSNYYAEVLTTRKYIMTMKEVNMNESNTQEEYTYDCSSSLSERL
ncbi:uncharacterized protein RHIMIDRAFT_303983 [Rhizopus microsporus ATCC 52813]|uniref:Uncharacterized protein n=1 Tax=Rhizopus microsporus ATCC 52813 TaxID=1340429 RepID=A0A2G4T0K3_RHIZD|nr:uncharacterized protein RHIMIDRAFT_303983 [Rhizopus microsporus ATCC 52813]PHZ14531.1 hypothetical protein RHIMIDRAFT_303983 [Rhizopus microsporus ATCC 52813]